METALRKQIPFRRAGFAGQAEPVETVGIELTFAIAQRTAFTSVAGALSLAFCLPTPAGLQVASFEEMFPDRLRRASQGEPAI